MTGPEAKRLVLIGVTGAGTLAAIDQLRQGRVPSVRIGAGVLVTGAILLGAAEVAPSVAGGFAMLIFVTSAFVLGEGAWRGITKVTKS